MGMNRRERPYAICFSSQRPQSVNVADDAANDVGYDAKVIVTKVGPPDERVKAPFFHGSILLGLAPRYGMVRRAGYKHRFSSKINPARE